MTLPINVKEEVLSAETRIRSYIVETPLEYSPYLSQLAECNVLLKLETVQTTGSFKYRGAVNRILSLTPEEQAGGIITSSSGNHGAAFTYASKKLGCKGTLFLPENVSKAKWELIRL
ncbi:MAG: pyridoxal-phosphate dependent enzyme [bacterium]|nr:pyridoxal-phosphate dependent enzyme [bacterium]